MSRCRAWLAGATNAMIVLPLLIAIIARAPDVIVFDVHIGRAVGPLWAVIFCVIALLGIGILSVVGHPLVGTGVAALVFGIMKYQADDALVAPMLECPSGPGGRCVALVTGANSGIGLAISHALAVQGHTVILGCRDFKKCAHAKASILQEHRSNASVYALHGLDLTSLTQTSMFAFNLEASQNAGTFGKLDFVFMNAGLLPVGNTKTREGFEMGFGVMHVAHFALFRFLQQQRALAVDPRVVVVSSDAMRFGSFHSSLGSGAAGEGDLRGELTYGCSTPFPLCPRLEDGKGFADGFQAASWNFGSYSRSKLANALYARGLAQRGISAASVHPGMVYTPMTMSAWSGTTVLMHVMDVFYEFVLRPPSAAAAAVLHAGLRENMQGGFLNGMGQVLDDRLLPAAAADNASARRLWEITDWHLKRWDETSR